MSNLELLTTAQVAEMLDVDVRTVARWVNAGRLTPAVQAPGIRGARMFRAVDVLALAAEMARSKSA